MGTPNILTTINEAARLKFIDDAFGNRLALSYDGNGRLTNVVDNLGLSGRSGLTFTYYGTTQHIQTVKDWTNRTWTFHFDANNNHV